MSDLRRNFETLVIFGIICMGIYGVVGCTTTPPGTGAACDALRPVLPTYSTKDTEQSKEEGATFLDVFNATCGKG